MARKSVFISIGSRFADHQEKFLDALMDLLRSRDIEPRVINKTDYPPGNPLNAISQLMRECDGVIVVAFERTYLETGLDKRVTPIGSLRYTTPWSQIEASMAFALGLPTFVLLESGLREEGLLEEKYDWYIERVKISADAFTDKGVEGRIRAWCRHVQDAKPPPEVKRKIDGTITLADVLQLPVKTLISLGAILLGAVVFGAAIAHSDIGEALLKWAKILPP